MASRFIPRIISRLAPLRTRLIATFRLDRNFSSGPASSSSTPQQPWCYTGIKPSFNDLKMGLDYHHWRVVVDKPVGDPTREQIIDNYIDILATVTGSKADARLKIYSISTKYYFEFGVNVPEDVAKHLRGVPQVDRVIPDTYYAAGAKSYGGEPFNNGQAAPYEDKYHAWYVRLNAAHKRIDMSSNVISPFWSKAMDWSKKIPGYWAYRTCMKLYKATRPRNESK